MFHWHDTSPKIRVNITDSTQVYKILPSMGFTAYTTTKLENVSHSTKVMVVVAVSNTWQMLFPKGDDNNEDNQGCFGS